MKDDIASLLANIWAMCCTSNVVYTKGMQSYARRRWDQTAWHLSHEKHRRKRWWRISWDSCSECCNVWWRRRDGELNAEPETTGLTGYRTQEQHDQKCSTVLENAWRKTQYWKDLKCEYEGAHTFYIRNRQKCAAGRRISGHQANALSVLTRRTLVALLPERDYVTFGYLL